MLENRFKKELAGITEICENFGLNFTFLADSFPIKAIIQVDENGQQSFFDEENEETSKQPAKIEFVFADELLIRMDGEQTLDETTFSKLKNKIKRAHYYFLQQWYYHLKMTGGADYEYKE